MRFGPWLLIDAAAAHAPEGPGVLQARGDALMTFPRGKSAMVFYAASRESLKVALPDALATATAHGARLVRFAETADPEGALARLLANFEERFGAPPPGNAK